jgi:hypothetical protein
MVKLRYGEAIIIIIIMALRPLVGPSPLFQFLDSVQNRYSSPSIIRIIKSRRIRWAGHVARLGGRGMHIGYGWESQKIRGHWEDQHVGGWTILKWILER